MSTALKFSKVMSFGSFYDHDNGSFHSAHLGVRTYENENECETHERIERPNGRIYFFMSDGNVLRTSPLDQGQAQVDLILRK